MGTTEVSFLPNNYDVPVTVGNYMKLEDGDNVFRALSSVVVGYQYWNKENKPVRLQEVPKTLPEDIRLEKDGITPTKIKHFWAFLVWNYKQNKIQVLELTQKTVMSAIQSLAKDEDWGSPQNYDIRVIRDGEGLDTEYTVNPKPKTALKPEIKQQLENTPFDLSLLFIGGDPFKPTTSDGKDMPKF